MAGSSSLVSESTMDVEIIYSILRTEEEEDDEYYSFWNANYDEKSVIQSKNLTAIENLVPKSQSTFRGFVLWKKEGFLANDTTTYISRLRVGDKKNFDSIIQITAFNDSGRWIQQNIQEGVSYEFTGLKLRKSNHRYVPLSHEVECIYDERYATTPVKVPTLPSYPTTMYCKFTPLDKIWTTSTCIETIGIVLKPGKIYRKGKNSVREIVLVDKNCYKVPVLLWNHEVYNFAWKEGTVLLVQGLKVMFSGQNVSFALLRCKYTEVNPQIEESIALKKCWFEEGGSQMNFVDFGNFENRFKKFEDALNEYIAADPKPTITSLAHKYNMAQLTLNRFFNQNGITRNNPRQRETVIRINERYTEKNKVDPTHTIQKEITNQNAPISVTAVKSFRSLAGKSRRQQQRPRNGKETGEKVAQYLDREPGQTMRNFVGNDTKAYARLATALSISGNTKSQQVGKIARAILHGLKNRFSPMRMSGTPYSYYNTLANYINKKEPNSVVKGDAIRKAVAKYKNQKNWEEIVAEKAKMK